MQVELLSCFTLSPASRREVPELQHLYRILHHSEPNQQQILSCNSFQLEQIVQSALGNLRHYNRSFAASSFCSAGAAQLGGFGMVQSAPGSAESLLLPGAGTVGSPDHLKQQLKQQALRKGWCWHCCLSGARIKQRPAGLFLLCRTSAVQGQKQLCPWYLMSA